MNPPPLPSLIFSAGLLVPLLGLGSLDTACAFEANYDEAKVGTYVLPDPLIAADGSRITTPKRWQEQRRPEILEIFATQVYGRSPGRPPGMMFEVTSEDAQALGGQATRKEITIHPLGWRKGPPLHLLLYLPNRTPGPVPVFLGLNFGGNHTVQADPGITLHARWTQDRQTKAINRAAPAASTRGAAAASWPVPRILARGCGFATMDYADVEPDFDGGWRLGIRGALGKDGTNTVFAPDDWGALAAWAWGLSRALDYCAVDSRVDARRVAVLGHSRLGKAALWAGASDERFAVIISNESGAGGAALNRRIYGETIERITTSFPHWFCGNFKQYSLRENDLAVDQHELLALLAPRPLYVASAEGDRWSDPRGEFLGALHADPVYRLLGTPGLGVAEMPGIDQPVGRTVGYHIRAGKHDLLAYDWEQYLNFAERHFRPIRR